MATPSQIISAPLPPVHSFAQVQAIHKQEQELIQSRSEQVNDYRKAQASQIAQEKQEAHLAVLNQQAALDLAPIGTLQAHPAKKFSNDQLIHADFLPYIAVVAVIFIAIFMIFKRKKRQVTD